MKIAREREREQKKKQVFAQIVQCYKDQADKMGTSVGRG